MPYCWQSPVQALEGVVFDTPSLVPLGESRVTHPLNTPKTTKEIGPRDQGTWEATPGKL